MSPASLNRPNSTSGSLAAQILDRRKLPFVSDLHHEISRSWKQSFSSRLLLDAPISQTWLFVEAATSVVEKFNSDKSQSAALKQFMPRRMRDPPTLPPPTCRQSAPHLVRSPPAGAAPWLIPPDYGLGSPTDDLADG